MTTHQQDSSQPQQSHDSPQETGLGLMMDTMEEVVLPGMMKVVVEVGLRDNEMGLSVLGPGLTYQLPVREKGIGRRSFRCCCDERRYSGSVAVDGVMNFERMRLVGEKMAQLYIRIKYNTPPG